MFDDDTLDIPVDVLCCSPAGRLLKVRRSEWLPHGGRVARGGVGMDADGEVLGWVAYADRADELACPSWPEQALRLTLDQIFPASAEIDLCYRGGDWRRAAGTVNARLARDCGVGPTRLDGERAERAWRTVSARMAGEAHRQAKRAFRDRAAGGPDDLI
jgi:hypothetical protein